MARAILGGGCFWCVEGAYRGIKGVDSALPGYAGGEDKQPTYAAVCDGITGHAEVVEVIFDESVISYRDILRVFFTVHDATQLNRQGNDIGTQYRSCIMPTNPDQAQQARVVIEEMNEVWEGKIVTTIEEPLNFTIAEEYHHDYYARNPNTGYCFAVVGPKLAKVRKELSEYYI